MQQWDGYWMVVRKYPDRTEKITNRRLFREHAEVLAAQERVSCIDPGDEVCVIRDLDADIDDEWD